MIIHNPILTGSLTLNNVNLSTGNLVTTGSNTFVGNQILSGSLTVSGSVSATGTLTAQTLVVQTVTSSVLYSSGSNIFGNNIANTQVMTGSVTVTGSLAVVTNGTEFQVNSTGVNIGNALTDSHVISGSFRVNPGGLFVSSSGNVGMGTTNPTNKLEIIGVSGSTGIITPLYVNGWNATTNVGGTNTSYGGIHLSNAVDTTAVLRLLGSGHIQLATDSTGRFMSFATDAFVERMRIASGGGVGIGTTNPIFQFDISTANYRSFRIQSSDDALITMGSTIASSQFYSIGVSSNTSGQGANLFWIGTSTNNPSGTLTKNLIINSSGVISEPTQPVAIGALVSDQSISATTFTILNFDTGTGYYARNIGSAWNNSTRTFTAPSTGTYVVGVSVFTNCIGQVAMFVNGGRTISIVSGTAISSSTTWNGECMVYLNSGDALTLRGYGDGSGTLFANGFHTWFQIRFLG